MTTPAYIYTGNHGSTLGIEDIVETIRSAFAGPLSLRVVKALVPGQINFIIDEFSRLESLVTLENLRKQAPGTRIVLVATEFLTDGPLGRRTFNYFEKGLRRRIVLNIIDRLQPLPLKALHRPDQNLIANPAAFPSLGKKAANAVLSRLWSRYGNLHTMNYMQRRCDGFLRAVGQADLVLTLHEGIAGALRDYAKEEGGELPEIFALLPVIDEAEFTRVFKRQDRDFAFEITGSLTSYRLAIASAVDQILSAGLNGVGPVRRSAFEDRRNGAAERDPAFSLHVPQTRNWTFSSPMRIYRSFRMGKLPVITRRFSDHPIEEACLLLDGSMGQVARLRYDWEYDFPAVADRVAGPLAAYNKTAQAHNGEALAAIQCQKPKPRRPGGKRSG